MNWENLDDFTTQYLETALWSSTGDDESPLDDTYEVEDFTEEALKKATKDCNDFKKQAGTLLEGLDDMQTAHDFWLTRNGHGAGFWNRGLGELGNKLTKICEEMGSCDVYETDDCKLHLT